MRSLIFISDNLISKKLSCFFRCAKGGMRFMRFSKAKEALCEAKSSRAEPVASINKIKTAVNGCCK